MEASTSCHFIERTDGHPPVDRQAQAAFNLSAKMHLPAHGHYRLLSPWCSIFRRSDSNQGTPQRRFSGTMGGSAIIFRKDGSTSDAMAAAQCIDDLKEAGLDYGQARILVEFIVRSQEHLATRQDIKALEVRIDGLEARIDRLEARIDRLEARIDSLEARIDGLDVKIGSLAVDMKAFEARFARQLYVFGFGIIGSMMAMMGLFVALQVPG